MSKDSELLRRYARDQDAEAFTELANRYAGLVYNACARVTGNMQDAEDAAQECFMALARNAGSIAAPLPAWLHVTAANRARNVLRSSARRKRREAVAATRTESNAGPEWQDIEPHVDAALLEIPEKLRLPIVLC